MVTPDNELSVPRNDWQGVTEAERGHFRALLDRYLLPLVTEMPRDSTGRLRILSVACGKAYEVAPLLDSFTRSTFKGIDNDSYRISRAREVNKDVDVNRAELTEEDAGELIPSEIGKYGLVIVRHAQVFGQMDEAFFNIMAAILQHRDLTSYSTVSENWKRIFNGISSKLAPGGYVFATTIDLFESDAVLECLKGKGITVLTSESQRLSRVNSYGACFSDQNIILGKKQIK